MLPLAPGRFSTTTAWPSRWPRGSATTRALLSATPPGANGTTMRTGFDGYSCACAASAQVAARAASSVFMEILLGAILTGTVLGRIFSRLRAHDVCMKARTLLTWRRHDEQERSAACGKTR